MASSRQRFISARGWRLLGPVLLLAVVATLGRGLSFGAPLLLLALLIALYYRDPRREIPSTPLGVVSPADGRLKEAGPAQDAFLGRRALHIVIRPYWLGAYSLYSPVEGKVMELMRNDDLAEPGAGFFLRTDEGDDVVMVLRSFSQFSLRRLYLPVGDRLGQGKPFASSRFISRIDIYLPAGSRLNGEPGRRVTGARDVIAFLTHDRSAQGE
jgi:phosphatidylserine decarboxylase